MWSCSAMGPINIPQPSAVMGRFDLAPLWSCVAQLYAGPYETHHATGSCYWLMLKLISGCNYPPAGPQRNRDFGYMIWILHECECVNYGSREIWEAGSLRCSVGFVICPCSMRPGCGYFELCRKGWWEYGRDFFFKVCGNTAPVTRPDQIHQKCKCVYMHFFHVDHRLIFLTLVCFSVSSATWSQLTARLNMSRWVGSVQMCEHLYVSVSSSVRVCVCVCVCVCVHCTYVESNYFPQKSLSLNEKRSASLSLTGDQCSIMIDIITDHYFSI